MKKHIGKQSIIIALTVTLFVGLFLILLNYFSKERLFKKDLECLQSVRSVEKYANVVFYSTKRNSCVYIVGLKVYDLLDRTSEIESYSCARPFPTVCNNEPLDTYMNCINIHRNIHKDEYDKADNKCNIEKIEFIEKIKTQYR